MSAYKLSIDIAKEHPVFGIGFGGFNGYNNLEWTRIIKYSHNIILEILCELGLIGLLVFSGLFVFIVRSMFNTQSLKFNGQSKFINPAAAGRHKLSIIILFVFSFWLAMFSKDISTQGFLWLFIVFVGKSNK